MFSLSNSVNEVETEDLGDKSIPNKREESGINIPKKGRMKPELFLKEDEHGFKTQTRKKANKKVYHGLLSRKTDHYNKVPVDVDDFHTNYYVGNYGNTEEERQQYGDPYETSASSRVPSSQEILDLSQENLTSDLDDSFQSYHGKSDNRRKARCKRLKRRNLELFKVLKRSETRLGIAKQDCMDLN